MSKFLQTARCEMVIPSSNATGKSFEPRVSVVMSVYNGAIELECTVESILKQTLMDFEFIIVNDGSTDNTAEILERYRNLDNRIKVIEQSNQGLTRALNNGCQAARGSIIARQDVGDRSFPCRLERQVAALDADPRVVAVGVGSRRVGPNGEFLSNQVRYLSADEVTGELLSRGVGLLHASSAFRRDAFHRVGGYRTEFRFAQDTDLWYRLSSIGLLAECNEVLFEIQIASTGISATQIERQVRLSELARACYTLRMAGSSENTALDEARRISQETGSCSSPESVRRKVANACYFIGSQLYQRRDRRCRTYLVQAMRSPPRFCGALAKYLSSFVFCDAFSRQSKSLDLDSESVPVWPQ